MSLIESYFQEQLNFINRIEDILNSHNINTDDIIYIKFYAMNSNKEESIKEASLRILPWKEFIRTRNEDFFYKNKKIFGELPEDKVNYFSDLWKKGVFDEEDKKEIWEFMDCFVAYAEQYKKNK
jgi:hypothetical protein